jgi:hypothetical protein
MDELADHLREHDRRHYERVEAAHVEAIEATPTLHGDDARRLLDDLQRVCSPEEARRRIAMGKRLRAELMRPKTPFDHIPRSTPIDHISTEEA